MNPEAIKRLIRHTKGLFPTMTPEQSAVLGDIIAGLSEDRAKTIIDAHSFEHDFLSIPALKTAADIEKNRPRQGEIVTCEPMSHIVARQFQCNPLEATLRYWRAEWFRYATRANERYTGLVGTAAAVATQQAEGMRRKCRTGAIAWLTSERVTYGAAEKWAAAVFWPPADFQRALQDLRDNGMDTVVVDEAQETKPFMSVFSVKA